ncbi:MAG: hypothetical protein LLF86_08740 [Nitrospiraceae bacterium]|nr:hypothetical protein [Nitrospiraceae bacterium]
MFGLIMALHVLSVVIWIGGVAFVTMIVFPMIMRTEGSLQKVLFFQGIEHRFARIAKWCVAVSGATGLLLLQITNEWSILFRKAGIGPTVMLIVWTIYLLVLLFESKLFSVIFGKADSEDSTKIFRKLTIFHWIVLVLSLAAVGIGVWAGHGGAV